MFYTSLFQVLYGEKKPSIAASPCSSSSSQSSEGVAMGEGHAPYPSPELLQLLRISSFPGAGPSEKGGTPYADSGTESADPEHGNLFQVMIGQFYVAQKRRSADFEALKLGNVRSGDGMLILR